MLHLFKRVYLSIDETLDTSNHRIVISQDYGYPMVTDQTNLGTLLNYATSLDAVIGPDAAFANYLGFFNYLDGQCDSLDAQLVVYADKDAFVKVGDSISQGSTICIIEAMKLFNEIESEFSGRIVKVLVDDESPVEYDQPLFLVDPA